MTTRLMTGVNDSVIKTKQMLNNEAERIGTSIQEYVRARWGDEPDEAVSTRLGGRLEPRLKERIDILGLDGERLLEVGPREVLAELEMLERASAREDARAEAAAFRVRAREVNGYDAKDPPRRGVGINPGRRRQPAGHRRSRQRSQR